MRLSLRSLATVLLMACVSLPAAAADNPLRLAGEQHNQYLACLSANAQPGVSPLVTLVRRCGLEPAMPVQEFVATFRPLVESDPTVPLAERMAPFRDRYSEYAFGFFGRIDAVLDVAKDEADADAQLVALEREAVSELDHASFAGQSVLAALSVARSSLHYWTRVEPIPEPDPSERGRWPRWLKVLAVIGADIGGLLLAMELTAGIGVPAISAAVSYQAAVTIP